MTSLALREFHVRLGASFLSVNGAEMVSDYGEVRREYELLRQTSGLVDLSPRGRLCLTGADRVRFLNGQVTNDVKALHTGQGCYAALVNAKGRMQSDLFIYALADELLLDLEPGYQAVVAERLEKFVIAEDVQVVDAAPHYGLFTVQGPKAKQVLSAAGLPSPDQPLAIARLEDAEDGEFYLAHHSRAGSAGYDVFVPVAALERWADRLLTSTRSAGGEPCGWTAMETARIEAGLPRFGADMDDTTLPPEAGIESRAISYTKGCYTGQEVIARIRTYGQVAKALRVLQLTADGNAVPSRGEKLFHEGKEVGFITTAARSPSTNAITALGYVRKECNAPGTQLKLRSEGNEIEARIVSPPSTIL